MQFVALDGEGIDEKYCLLQDSEGGELYDAGGLGTEQVFRFLFKRGLELASLGPVFVGFVTTYDVNMILRDLDDETLRKIYQTEDKDFVSWRGYEILYFPRKIFKLRVSRYAHGEQTSVFSFTWFDVFSFFGSSFIRACAGDVRGGQTHGSLIVTGEGFLGEIPRAIVSGKEARSRFKYGDLERIRSYNKLEVKWLVKLCDKLNEIFLSRGINLKSWHGPGAVAAYVLGKGWLNIRAEYPAFNGYQVPSALFQAWDCAYYGGRFENMGIGTFPDVHSYDINSAYPYALSMLSVLKYGDQWKRINRPSGVFYGPQSVYLVAWDLPSGVPFGPFPWRHKSGAIYYPLNGLGWYWHPEVAAALDNPVFSPHIKLWEAWYQEEGEPSIFSTAIPEFYALRQKLKKEGNPGEYALKIALNSIYGKLAQKIGRAPYRCIPWAGWITSHTRSLLLRASMGRECEILAFATDAVFSRAGLPLPLGSGLGEWKPEHYKKALILMNGFYRMDAETRKRKSATRGLPPVKEQKESENDVTWEEIIQGLNASQQFRYKFTQFVTHSMALHFPNVFGRDRLRFVVSEKVLSPFAHTRRLFAKQSLSNWEAEFTTSAPVRFPTQELSFPSSLPFATVTLEEDEENA